MNSVTPTIVLSAPIARNVIILWHSARFAEVKYLPINQFIFSLACSPIFILLAETLGNRTLRQPYYNLEMEDKHREIREQILDSSFLANKGHVGSALSVVELLSSVLDCVRGLGSDDLSRDRFILSKGHSALTLYAELNRRGLMSDEVLESYSRDGSLLGTHPYRQMSGIDFSTGSLGQGLTFAVGASLAALLRRDGGKVFCLCSDAELNEGSFWEGIFFAGHHALSNLTVLVDVNGQQALAPTKEVIDMSNAPEAARAHNWEVLSLDGHSSEELVDALGQAGKSKTPSVIFARTISGKGVDFMEREVAWHYHALDSDSLREAKSSLVRHLS